MFSNNQLIIVTRKTTLYLSTHSSVEFTFKQFFFSIQLSYIVNLTLKENLQIITIHRDSIIVIQSNVGSNMFKLFFCNLYLF